MVPIHCSRHGLSVDTWYPPVHHISKWRGESNLYIVSFPCPLNAGCQIWGVKLLWWSIWLSVVWGGEFDI